MPGRLRNLYTIVLDQVPTVLALAVLGGVAWWGYVLLYATETNNSVEAAQSQEDEETTESAEKTLSSIQLASEEVLERAGIKTGNVEERLIGVYVKAHGHVDFNQNHYAHLSTRARGTAWSVHKQPGDEVKKGDVLALIASPDLARLKFDLQETLLMVQRHDRFYQRLKGAKESVPKKDLDSAEFNWREARVRLSKDQQSLRNLGLNVSLEELLPLRDEQVTARLRTLGIPDSLLQRLDGGTLTNNLLPMYAPFDGLVVKRDIVIGEMVTPETPQFVLADLRQLWIILHVRLEDVGKLSVGQEVAFHLDGSNEDAPPAKITWISAEADERTRTVSVRVDVANPKSQLRPNSFGDARIVLRRETRLTVPNEAVQFDGVRNVVFARGQSPTEFQPLPVTLGPRHEDFTVVLSGVQAGQTIAIAGSHVLLSEMQKDRIEGDD